MNKLKDRPGHKFIHILSKKTIYTYDRVILLRKVSISIKMYAYVAALIASAVEILLNKAVYN